MFEHCGKIIYTKYWGILAVCWKLGKFIYTNTEEYFMLNTGNIYLHKILRNTLCWALWEDLFTQNTEEYCMLSTVGRFIYTKYLGLLLVEHCWNIYLYKILGNTLCWPMWEYLFTQNTEEYTVCWTLWEDLFTQNTGDYFLLNTVGRFIYIKYWGILYVEQWEDLFTKNTEEYCMLYTVRRFIYSKYWGILYVEYCGKIYLHKILRNILYVEHCGKIYLHKILRNTERGTLRDLFTQNTEEYFMLNTVKRFIYTTYWGIVNADHCGKIYLHKLLRNTLCWALWEDLFTHNTEEYCMLNTGKIYLHKILRNTVHWTLWEDLSTQNTEDTVLNTEKIYLHKILRNTSCWTLWEDLFPQNSEEYFVEHCGKIYLHKILRNTLC
jgi:hypothetical protein